MTSQANQAQPSVLIIIGSSESRSHSLALGQTISTSLQALGAKTELINLFDYQLPMYDRQVERNDTYDDKTRAFLAKSQAADAFVWVTPIYHNSFSGLLKNALDWQHTKFPEKVVGLASNGGDRSTQAVDQLMLIARSQHLFTGRVRVCTDATDYDENLQLQDSALTERIETFNLELLSLVTMLRSVSPAANAQS